MSNTAMMIMRERIAWQNINSLAIACIEEAVNPFDVFSNSIAKAVIAELDAMVENGEIEDVVSSLDEIIMVIDWIEG